MSNQLQKEEDNYELKCQSTDDMNKLTDKKNNVLIEENKNSNSNKKDKVFKQIQKIILIIFLLLVFTLIFGYLIYNYIFVKIFVHDTVPNVLKGGKRFKR